eukprot:606327_1
MSTKAKTEQELQSELDDIKRDHEALKRDYEALKQQGFEQKTKQKHSAKFWHAIRDKCEKNDTQYIKSLIDNKTLSVNDFDDSDGYTLLHYAADNGAYEIVQLCISLGADVTLKDNDGQTALDRADGEDHHAVKQLLHFAKMKANTGERVREKADDLTKQNGIIENLVNEIESYDDTTREFFEDTLLDLMNKIVRKKMIFSDDWLCLAWKIEAKRGNVFQSELWKNMTAVCREIIQNRDKRDWFFMKTCIIPSNLWFEKMNDDGEYLYYELLRIVKDKSIGLVADLEENITSDGDKNKGAWTELITYEIPANKLVKLQPLIINGAVEETVIARQDTIPNGLTSQYNKAMLDTNVSNKSFDASSFYDHYVYLSTLSLLSQSVDDAFHASMHQIFNVNTEYGANIGYIEDDDAKYKEDTAEGIPLWYGRGPVKLLERARNKAQNDYMTEGYPTAACVLDLNRCSLVFEDITSLLKGIKHFVNKIRSYQSDAIIGIVRIKNGFKEYIKSPQYADVKLNVLIRGESHNIVGEVQFLLKTMESFKKRAHNLYSIEREEEFMEQTASKVLPLLLDGDKQHLVMAKLGDAKGLQRWMIFRNKTAQDVLPDDDTLKLVLQSGNMRCLKWIISFQQQIDNILMDEDGKYHLCKVIAYGYFPIIKQLINTPRVLELCKNDWKQTIVAHMFKYCENMKVVDYVLDVLGVSSEDIIKALGGSDVWEWVESLNANSLLILQRIVHKIGETEFVNVAFPDKEMNVLDAAVKNRKMDDIKYLLSMKPIRTRYDCKDDSDELSEAIYRILHYTFVYSDDDDSVNDILNEFGLTKKIIARHLKYKKQMTFGLKVKQIMDIIGETCFIDHVLERDGENLNGLDHCIASDEDPLDKFKYLMSFASIKEKCVEDINILWTMIYMLQEEKENDVMMAGCIMSELRLTETKLREIQSYQYPEPENKEHLAIVIHSLFTLHLGGYDVREFW